MMVTTRWSCAVAVEVTAKSAANAIAQAVKTWFANVDAQSCHSLGVLPPPLWGRVGEGGGAVRHDRCHTAGPPPLTPPHKGEGNRPSMLRQRRSRLIEA